jgi:tRNA modification GTPase
MPSAYHPEDTIVAIASAPGGGARGILRISGLEVTRCLEKVFRASGVDGRAQHESGLSAVRYPTSIRGRVALDGDVRWLPCELFFWPTSRSFTGEPVAEIHTLGSPPLLEAALRTICETGARLAEPGEFTLRAFLAGRLDLTQAEAVLGVVNAANPRQLQVALAQLAGGLAGPLRALRDMLVDLLAQLEAGFDFADEDLAFITPGELQRQLDSATTTVSRLAEQMASRRDTADLVRVVLRGWPNTGKSSLFNALAEASRAIVSEQPGTTRDYLTAEISLGDAKCLLVDTAGVEVDPVDGDGLRQAAQTATSEQSRLAHVEILCLDATRPLNPWERAELASAATCRLLILTKADAPRGTDLALRAIETSSRTGKGLAALRAHLRDAVLAVRASGGDTVAGTAARCHESLRLAAESLDRAGQLVRIGGVEELVAAEIRVALEELGKVVGTVYTEEVLDRIFSRFCIGK